MYELTGVFSGTEVDLGSNLLIEGPPLCGKRRLALEILAHGTANGDGAIIVTTKDSANRVLSEYEGLLEGIDARRADIAIVDCVSKQHGSGHLEINDQIKYASSPVDMTGIGINISQILEEFQTQRDIRLNRMLVYSLSTLLMYSDLQTVFRFLHVLTGRVQSMHALGIYVIDSTAHEEKTLNTLKQLFDGIIQVTEDNRDAPSIRLSGSVS